MHGHGIGELEERMLEFLPPLAATDEEPDADDAPYRVAIVGRPNAGKSSLANHWLGSSRHVVSDVPGTTVDAIDSEIEVGGRRLVLTDTAGIRRKRSVGPGTEAMGVIQAVRSMERSHVVVLLVDAFRGVAEQDAKIAGLAVDRGRALLIALNKNDLLSEEERKKATKQVERTLAFAPWAPVVEISAKRERGAKSYFEKSRKLRSRIEPASPQASSIGFSSK